MINVLIVDDDPSVRNFLKKTLEPDHRLLIIDMVNSTALAMEVMEKRNIDLLFLDIHMPEEDGLQFAARLNSGSHHTHVIFVTAFPNYAIRAFSIRPYDYLLKPLSANEILSTVDRLVETIETERLLLLKNCRWGVNVPGKIKLKSKCGYFFVQPEKIVLFQSILGHCEAYYKDGNKEKIYWQLHQIFDMTMNHNFVQLNRSTIININYLSRVDKKEKIAIVQFAGQYLKFSVTKDKIKELEEIQSIRIG
jgi:DNA-binding LytR/AlgR family response regulator